MEYSAGNLELSILGFSQKAVASIDVTAKALRRLASAVDKINNTQFVYAGDKLEVIFTKIARATNSINTRNIENLAIAAKSLSSISRISNLDKMDFAKVGQGFSTLSIAIQPFLDKVKEAEASLTALDGILRRSSGKKMQSLLGGGGTTSRGGISAFGRLAISTHLMRKMGRFAANLVQAGSDYYETLNLWQVAMRNNLDIADQFINKMNKAYGISSNALMNAQATFKNMIGSLGQVTDETAYRLSEALVQMSADYASLYNRTLESAFQNMQSMLAGQVRPIRSAGLDMTETTLFMFYQQLGGTKTMRQLNRTEKQLLSILAVYQQMGSAGALGDMTKTLNQFANQSRMMTEYWAELKTWSGLLLKDLIDDWGILVKFNALLITTTEIIKAIAKSRGLGEDNFIDGMFEAAESTNDEIDELQGKLLDFDKFRSLEGASASTLAIDEKLIEAITGYSSKVDDARNKALELSKEWLALLGFTYDTNGELIITNDLLGKVNTKINSFISSLPEIDLNTIKSVLSVAGAFFNIVATAAPDLISILTAFSPAAVGIISVVSNIVTLLDKLGLLQTTIQLIIGYTLTKRILGVGKSIFTLTTKYIIPFFTTLKTHSTTTLPLATQGITTLQTAMMGLAGAFMIFGLSQMLSSEMTAGQKLQHLFIGLAAAAVAFGIALSALGGNWVKALTVAGVVAGGYYTIQALNVPNYEMGASDIDSGTVFRAGEFGKTEAVYTGSNGKTNVANVRQMEQAFYNALSRHSKEGNGTIVVEAYLDGEKVYENTTARAKSRGNVWAKA